MSQYIADYGATDIEIVDGEGSFLIDRAGKRYVDFLGGWCVATVGWKNPKIRDAALEAAKKGLYVPPSLSWPEWEAFAKLLADITPGKLSRTFRATSGSEAVEFAIKLARAATGKKTIVSVERVYHGHTYGAASVGVALSPAIAPGVPGIVKLPMPDEYRNHFNLTGAALSDAIVSEFEKIAKEGDVAAFMSEPIFTNAGAILPPADFYPKLAAVCKKYGALLVMDEVATGFGRTGKLFASEHWGIEPDIMCLGKALTGGYATLGATIVTEEVYEKSHDIPSYSTFGWMPSDMLVARANVELVLAEQLWKNSAKIGDYLLELLKPLEELPNIGQVRGKGLLLAVEFVRDRESKKRDAELASKAYGQCLKQGLVAENYPPGILFMSPALNMDEKTAREGADILKNVIRGVLG